MQASRPTPATPELGALVHVRTRRWLVERVHPNEDQRASPIVDLACADDDAQGQTLSVYWHSELDARILGDESWGFVSQLGFDPAEQFAAYFHTLRWGTVTATDPELFQAPFRAGIKIDAYQMEPLRKALHLPRVNLFIADDTGLGKTIEAGLIARELLLRKKVKKIVVAAPPSVLEQWRMELEERFGLTFVVLDRAYFAQVRQQRGFSVNPWRTHSRFLVSHNLLAEPAYADPMREWLGDFSPGTLLILDEAHHAAPASGARYGIESKFTRAVRDLAARFEHRLFLSATPHNGHSNSFSTLLEILDPHRFTRGVPVSGKKDLDEVMVRRLKEDIREIQGGFPVRRVVRVPIEGLPEDAPELMLSRLLDQYRTAREERLSTSSRKAQAASGLLLVGLQQRLLSSTEAFARTLQVHMKTVERHWANALEEAEGDVEALLGAPDADDERADWTDEQLLQEEDSAVIAATAASGEQAATEQIEVERKLLLQMERIAEEARHRPDAKFLTLLQWIREHMCADLPPIGQSPTSPELRWNNRRLIIFTENREGTKRYLKLLLEQALGGGYAAEQRLAVIDGLTPPQVRKEIQRRFNADPETEPLRILLATDAAREGLNFQAHCSDLFHYDLPWNPGRIEQRNGRIDRKLQLAAEVRCHYFSIPQRVEDRVLEVLVEKTERIKRELGSLAKVIEDDIERKLQHGIRHAEAATLAAQINDFDLDQEKRAVVAQELDEARARRDDLKEQIHRCQRLLEKSREWTNFQPVPFRSALSCALMLQNCEGLIEGKDADGNPVWTFPPLEHKGRADASWTNTLDSLRAPRKPDQKVADWRRDAPIRPVVFEDAGRLTEDTVHLHLEQRVVQRLLSRFKSQGFVYHDLSRACLAQTRDSVPRVILLGRLFLYGSGAERLHEVIVPVTARWNDPDKRNKPLEQYGTDTEAKTLQLLEEALAQTPRQPNETIQNRLLAAARQDIEELLPQLQKRAEALAETAIASLGRRGEKEAQALHEILVRQEKRVRDELKKHSDQLVLNLDEEEKRQLEADKRSWQVRLKQFARELKEEPARVRAFYQVKTQRIEPVGIVYLWPESN